MNRRRFLLMTGALLAAPLQLPAADSGTHGLMWRVRCGDAPPSHLFGTLHSGDRRVLARGEPLLPLIRQARLFMPELLTDAEAVSLYQAASLSDGNDLPRKVGRARWARIERTLAQHGVGASIAQRLRPWAALLTLLQPLHAAQPSLDEAFIAFARRQGVAIQPIETVQEQIDAVALLPETTLIALLVDASRRHDTLQAAIDPMIAAWLEGDVDRLARINSALMPDDPALKAHSERFIDALLDRRNGRFVERLLPALREGSVVAAFGASHLSGQDGVLARLGRAGCEIQPAD